MVPQKGWGCASLCAHLGLLLSTQLCQKLCQHQRVHGKEGRQRDTSFPQFPWPNGFKIKNITAAGQMHWLSSHISDELVPPTLSPALTGFLYHIPADGVGNAIPEDSHSPPISTKVLTPKKSSPLM